MKKKILIIPDIPHNAADLAVECIIKYASPYYQFEKIYEGQEGRRGLRSEGKPWGIDYSKYDGVFYMMGNRWDVAMPKEKSLVTAIEMNEVANLPECKSVGVVANHMMRINRKTVLLEWGVDRDLFKPNRMLTPINDRKDLIIGFAGMPANTRKCFEENFEPLTKIDGVKAILAASHMKGGNWCGRPYIGMPNYYNSIDLYVQPSKSDGLPITVVEASACGTPCIGSNNIGATRVLAVSIEPTSNNFIEAVKNINNNRELLENMKKETLNKVKEWDWRVKIKPYLDEFKKICA